MVPVHFEQLSASAKAKYSPVINPSYRVVNGIIKDDRMNRECRYSKSG
jgi:hypothetical protein